MVADRNHPSDSIASKQEVIPNTEVRNMVFSMGEELKNQLKDYHSQYNTLEKRVKGLEKNVCFLKDDFDNLEECVNREYVVDLIHKIVPSLIGKKDKDPSYPSESSEDSDSVEIIEVRGKKAVPYKLRTRA
ncbi:hypothetical protein GLOIN_2v1791229 [Rhizophagus clarus]|uniref:Uncharacterized protein n=1 Tax=Rhizophagus clarus TaxID=94130 RepID=A0A8H3KV52_9GLOM|nr:hypothetical protein GLOIN_2v1791229 [Rhizophagus clarus]